MEENNDSSPGNKLAKTRHSLYTEHTSTATQGANGRAEKIAEQKHDMVTKNPSWEKNEMNNRDEYGLATALTWSRKTTSN